MRRERRRTVPRPSFGSAKGPSRAPTVQVAGGRAAGSGSRLPGAPSAPVEGRRVYTPWEELPLGLKCGVPDLRDARGGRRGRGGRCCGSVRSRVPVRSCWQVPDVLRPTRARVAVKGQVGGKRRAIRGRKGRRGTFHRDPQTSRRWKACEDYLDDQAGGTVGRRGGR